MHRSTLVFVFGCVCNCEAQQYYHTSMRNPTYQQHSGVEYHSTKKDGTVESPMKDDRMRRRKAGVHTHFDERAYKRTTTTHPQLRSNAKKSDLDRTFFNSAPVQTFKMKNSMLAWYCFNRDCDSECQEISPCVNMFHHTKPSKPNVAEDYKIVYHAFCDRATSHVHHRSICTNPTLRRMYA